MKLAADGMKRTTMELGGHAPVLVFDDVDVDQVLELSIGAKYRNAGQVCVSPTRYFVHEKIYAQFVDGFTARAKALNVNDGLAQGAQMGPLAHDRRAPVLEGLLADAKKSGAKFHTGGGRISRKGYFFEPTVISDVPNTARIMNEEPFGPIAMINPFTNYEDVIKQANRLPYGLAAYAFSRSSKTVNLLGEQIEAGMIGINSYQISVPESPFGGVKESGHGSEEGIEGLDACLVTKFVSES
jgi:succinate-semialdehyde dehydrogenase/glutarate-semialdehyde dehydrogenase